MNYCPICGKSVETVHNLYACANCGRVYFEGSRHDGSGRLIIVEITPKSQKCAELRRET